jgi:hypothetical protein
MAEGGRGREGSAVCVGLRNYFNVLV